MEFLRQLFHGKGYIDGITIINLDGEILFSAKLNSKFSNRKEREAYQALVGQNFFDVFENLNAKNSSMIRAMEVGLPVYVENQLLQTKGQEGIHISSLSIPIKSGRAVVGAIDLSMEEMTDGEEEPESVELTSEQIPVGGAGKLKKHSGASFTMEDIIAVDEKMKNARDYIPVVAACDLPVMIYGETGTGKEVFAQSIHNASERRDKPFIAQNCAAVAGTKNAKASIFHIEGDPDHPVNRGALCPKGAGLVDFIHSESRLKFPEYRAPGSDKWQQISWEEAFDRIAKLMKEDRDANYIAQNAEGVTVNRWLSTGMLCASASSNETGYLTQKFSRALGMLAVDNQARV